MFKEFFKSSQINVSKSNQAKYNLVQCQMSDCTYSLFLFPLLGHLIPEVAQLQGQGVDQLLCGLQLGLKCPTFILFPLHVLHCQAYRSQPKEPIKAPGLLGKQCSFQLN